MVKFYRTDDKLIHELDTLQGGTWIQMVNPSVAEGQMVADELNVDIEDVLAALDEEESSRIELQDGYTLILVDIPSIETRHDKESYTTIPLGIILTDDEIVTVCTEDTPVLQVFLNNRVKEFSTKKLSLNISPKKTPSPKSEEEPNIFQKPTKKSITKCGDFQNCLGTER